MSAPQKIEIDQVLAARTTITVDPEEPPAERTARLRKEDQQHTFQMCLKYTVLVVLLIVGGACFYASFLDVAASADTRRWAQTTLSALFTGTVSFVLGQMSVKAR